jgi:hypothetical protein
MRWLSLRVANRGQALELRDAMPYVLQFKAHEMVYEYIRLVVRLFEEGRGGTPLCRK